jgi:GTP-binding protein
MPKYYVRFLLSATHAGQFPEPEAPEVAFLGRSNVGKSSLINALLGERAARVSSTPGRTRAINFFALHDTPKQLQTRMIFADLPGYGYAKISKSISAEWPKFIEPYLAQRPSLVLCVCLVDMNVPLQQSDLQLAEYLQRSGRRTLVVGTKADKLSGNGLTQARQRLTYGLCVDGLLAVSARDGRGMGELWRGIHEACAVPGAGSAR